MQTECDMRRAAGARRGGVTALPLAAPRIFSTRVSRKSHLYKNESESITTLSIQKHVYRRV